VELHWHVPKDNGSPILGYRLEGKSTGDVYVTLYEGDKCRYLALGLFPEFSYSFRVAAYNTVGMSDMGESISVVTPANYLDKRFANTSSADCRNVFGYTELQVETAMRCREAWSEFWDPKTERVFYFNSILAMRQLEVPPVLLEEPSDEEKEEDAENAEGENETESETAMADIAERDRQRQGGSGTVTGGRNNSSQ
jgi:hypothetical protein